MDSVGSPRKALRQIQRLRKLGGTRVEAHDEHGVKWPEAVGGGLKR